MKKPARVGPTRRQFLTTTAGATAGMASRHALGKAPAVTGCKADLSAVEKAVFD